MCGVFLIIGCVVIFIEVSRCCIFLGDRGIGWVVVLMKLVMLLVLCMIF